MRTKAIILIGCLFIVSSLWAAPQLDSLLFQLDTVSNTINKQELLKSISSEYEKLGDTEMALLYSRRYNELKDSLYNDLVLKGVKKTDSIIGITEAEQKLKASQNSLLQTQEENKNTRTIIQQYWYLFLFLITVLIFILYRVFAKRKLKKLLTLEKEAVLKKHKTLEDAYANVFNAIEELKKKAEKEQQQEKKVLPDWFVKLSLREMEALSCLAIGMTDKEISQKMEVSLATVRTYCRRIYSKLLVKNRSEAANIAKTYNII